MQPSALFLQAFVEYSRVSGDMDLGTLASSPPIRWALIAAFLLALLWLLFGRRSGGRRRSPLGVAGLVALLGGAAYVAVTWLRIPLPWR